MRKIKSIRAINFQSHKDTLVEIPENLVAFIGESEQGKSVLTTKVLEWLINGTIIGEKRFGSAANSHWIQKKTKAGKVALTGETSGEVTFTDAITVKRSMDKSGTTYYVTYPDSREDLTLTGNNGKVPEVVQELFNFDNLNLANQFERIFLLHDTPGEIAKTLNKVCDMELPSKVMKEIKSDVRKAKGRQTLIEEDIDKLEDSLLGYQNLDEMEQDLDELEVLTEESVVKSTMLSDMERLNNSLEQVEKELYSYRDLEEKEKDITSLLTLVEKRDTINNELRLMESCLADFEYFDVELKKLGDVEQKVKEINELLLLMDERDKTERLLNDMDFKLMEVKNISKELKELKPQEYIDELNELIVLVDRRDETEKLYNSMSSSLEAVKTLSVSLKQVSERSIVLEKQLQEALKDGCPVCGK